MRTNAVAALCAVFCLAMLTMTAQAGVVAARKSSKIVTLRASGATCTGGLLLDTRVLPDGSTEPLLVPSKQVLVLTAVDWAVDPLNLAGTLLELHLGDAGPVAFVDSVFGHGGFERTGKTSSIANVVVGGDTQVCVVFSGARSVFNLVVHGFFAKDK